MSGSRMPCNCCEVTDHAFSEKEARRAAQQYRRRGPSGQTRAILKAIRARALNDLSILDIGGGIGAIHHELLEDVAREAIHVDASSAYLKQAREETARRGHSDRVEFIHADFTDAAVNLPKVDIVTLDRVVCCYPDFPRLLRAAAGRSEHLLAMTYPRDTWYLRLGLRIMNLIQALRQDPFRVFVHPVQEMDRVLNEQGMRRESVTRLFVWEMALYSRVRQ